MNVRFCEILIKLINKARENPNTPHSLLLATMDKQIEEADLRVTQHAKYRRTK